MPMLTLVHFPTAFLVSNGQGLCFFGGKLVVISQIVVNVASWQKRLRQIISQRRRELFRLII